MAAVSLSNHYSIIRELEQGNTPAAMRLVAALADRDVVELIETEGASLREERMEFQRKLLAAYARFRQRNPDLYGVPGYVDSAGRAEYERNLTRIRQFLEQSAPKN